VAAIRGLHRPQRIAAVHVAAGSAGGAGRPRHRPALASRLQRGHGCSSNCTGSPGTRRRAPGPHSIGRPRRRFRYRRGAAVAEAAEFDKNAMGRFASMTRPPFFPAPSAIPAPLRSRQPHPGHRPRSGPPRVASTRAQRASCSGAGSIHGACDPAGSRTWQGACAHGRCISRNGRRRSPAVPERSGQLSEWNTFRARCRGAARFLIGTSLQGLERDLTGSRDQGAAPGRVRPLPHPAPRTAIDPRACTHAQCSTSRHPRGRADSLHAAAARAHPQIAPCGERRAAGITLAGRPGACAPDAAAARRHIGLAAPALDSCVAPDVSAVVA